MYWQLVSPYIYTNQLMAQTQNEVEAVISLLNLQSGSKILDVACGNGRHSFCLGKKGYKMTAIDADPDVIEKNKSREKQEHVLINWLCEDMLDHKVSSSYQGIISLMYSFGCYENEKDNDQLIKQHFKSLTPGGKIILQLFNREAIEVWAPPRDWSLEDDGTYLLNKKKIDYGTGWMTEELILIRNKEVFAASTGIRLYYLSEIVGKLYNNGFRGIAAYGGFNKEEFVAGSPYLILLAEKPIVEGNMVRC